MDEVKPFIGIDVAKMQLEVFIWPGGETSVANHEVGILRLLRQLKPADFEAAGGLGDVRRCRASHRGDRSANQSGQVRDFARASGKLPKTGALDARCWRVSGTQFDQRAAIGE